MRWRRAIGAFAVAAVLASGAAAATFSEASGATTGLTMTKTVTRDHLENGADDVVDTRKVAVSVSQVSNLRNFQQIDVRWSGAHPTGGIVSDPNSGDASQEEYPVVLLECRGADSTSAQLDPSTCWTATSQERFQSSYNTAFPAWRVDRYAPPSQRTAVVGAPAPRPAACPSPAPAERWVPFAATGGKSYDGGAGGCAGMAPEAANVGGLSLPSNETFGVTQRDGTGSAKFDVWTAENNASLACSNTVACSLVVVPVMGISCDAAAASVPPGDRPQGSQVSDADSLCRASGQFQPGQVVSPAGREDVAVSGLLWWSASNWRNRLSVPLTFAPPSNSCDVVSKGDEVDIYGSELMTQAALQWSPHFCLDPKLFKVKHVQTPEPQARNLLDTASIEADFASAVPDGGFSKPVVSAPVAFTGFAIAFAVDDARGNPVTTLRLTPRLLAKLLTESYPAINAVQQEYPALSKNPLEMSSDPEFIALNPGITQGVPASQTASTLLSLSSDSDVLQALTSYITNDPEARAWLDGEPDPWGMVVNPNYKGIALPKNSWPLLDAFEPKKLYASDTNDCLYNDPVPYLPLVAAPMPRLGAIAQAMEFALANSQTVCQQVAEGTSAGEKLVALGRQTPGFRFMLGVTSLGDAARFGLDTASLETHVAPSAPVKFTSVDGRSFAAPDDVSLRAAAGLLHADGTTNTWPIPYDALRSDAGSGAYPGAMVVYAQVPTKGLAAADAADYAQVLRFAATDGQSPGDANGQLPDGYLPLTAADGLGPLARYTLAAADAVQAQQGAVPPVVAPASVSGGPSAPAPAGVAAGDVGGLGMPGAPAIGAPGTLSGPSLLLPADAIGSIATAHANGGLGGLLKRTLGALSRLAGAVLPLLLWLGVLSALSAFTVWMFERRRARRAART